MRDAQFAAEVDGIINKIAETIEDNDVECTYDLEFHDGILTFTNESGTYVINRHSIAKEIWLSSPISGPYHFALSKGQWRSRTGAEFFEVLATELNIPFESNLS